MTFPLIDQTENLFALLQTALCPEVDFDGATLIDTHEYKVNDVTYQQKVYRLKSNEIYIETENLTDGRNVKALNLKLKRAIATENYELAAQLRDKIKSIEANK